MNSYTADSELSRSTEFQQNLEILRRIRFFSGLPLEALKVLAYLCTRERFKAGDRLFQQDEDDGQAFYILSGKVSLLRAQEDQEDTVRTFEQDSFLGGLSLLGPMRRLFSLKAATEVTCLILTREKFTKAMTQFSACIPKIMEAIVHNVRLWEERQLLDHTRVCTECLHRAGVSLV